MKQAKEGVNSKQHFQFFRPNISVLARKNGDKICLEKEEGENRPVK